MVKPLPDSGMTCGLPAALSVMVSVPARKPAWLGAKITPMKQTPPKVGELTGGSGAVHWLSKEKSPVAVALLTIQFPLPSLMKLMRNSWRVPTRRSLTTNDGGKNI